jgi:hypothetical protein
LLNDCHSTDWAGYGEKKASLALKSQRRKKNWRCRFIFWRAYKTAKRHQIRAKNVHKTMVYVQKNWLFTSVLHPAGSEKCSPTGIFDARLPQILEQILF